MTHQHCVLDSLTNICWTMMEHLFLISLYKYCYAGNILYFISRFSVSCGRLLDDSYVFRVPLIFAWKPVVVPGAPQLATGPLSVDFLWITIRHFVMLTQSVWGNISPGNGLLPARVGWRRQIITWTNVDLSNIFFYVHLGTSSKEASPHELNP